MDEDTCLSSGNSRINDTQLLNDGGATRMLLEGRPSNSGRSTENQVIPSLRKIGPLVNDFCNELNDAVSQNYDTTNVPTGFLHVDQILHGLSGGDLSILAGRPGVGKTAFALNMATNVAKKGTTVAFFSFEMSTGQLVQRLISSEAMVGLDRLRSGKISEGDWMVITEAADRLNALDIRIDDTPGLSISEIRARACSDLGDIAAAYKKGVIMVDCLRHVQPNLREQGSNRFATLRDITLDLKALAKEMDMPVIALCQLNRSVEMRENKRPVLADFRELDSIDQDADIVMFIDRSMNEVEAEDADRPELGTATLIVAKHRNGPTADITMAFNPNFTKFGDFFDATKAIPKSE